MTGSAELPHPDEAVKLPITTLAARLLAVIETGRGYHGRRATIKGQLRQHWGDGVTYVGGRGKRTSTVDKNTYTDVISQAFDWLYVEGLTTRLWDPGENGRNDEWFNVTPQGRRFLARGDHALDAHRAEQLLGFDLHESIDGRVRRQFLLGETEAAVMIAMKEVEIRMRDAGELPAELVAVKLATAAFKPGEGPLHDPAAEGGEQEAAMSLFRGAMGIFRNPVAHRRVDYDDPVEAVEVILFADLLLRMIDRASAART